MTDQQFDDEQAIDFEQLLHGARSGGIDDRNALFAMVQRYLAYVAKNHFDPTWNAKTGVSDVVQQSMMNAARELSQFDGSTIEQFRSWLRQIVINEIRTLHRHYNAQRRSIVSEQTIEPDESRVIGIDVPGATKTPSQEVILSENSASVHRVLEKMPTEMRLVIQLRTWEQLQFNEIAERMGISLNRAAKLWYNALVEFERIHSELEND